MGIEAIGSAFARIGTSVATVASKVTDLGPSLGPVSGIKPAGLLPGFRPLVESTTPPSVGGIFRPLENFRPLPVIRQVEKAAPIKLGDLGIKSSRPFSEPRMIREATYWYTDVPGPRVVKPAEIIMPQVVEPIAVPLGFELKPRVVIALVPYSPKVIPWPALQPAIKVENAANIQVASQPKTETQAASKVAQSVSVKPAFQEEEAVKTKEKVRTGFGQEQQKVSTIELKEVEESELVDIVDEEVLSKRFNEFSQAANLAGEEAQNQGLLEINGRRIGELVPQETEDSRSGIIKKHGPDGSRVEIIEEIRMQRFRSIAEAKQQIAQTIARKVPVKKGKEGRRVGYGAVARVLKYLLIKYQPAREVAARAIKKVRVDRGK